MLIASIITITLLSYSPSDVSAEYDKISIPEISGTIIITETSGDYSDKAQIALTTYPKTDHFVNYL